MSWIIKCTLKSAVEGEIWFFSYYIVASVQYFRILLWKEEFVNIHLEFG